MASSTETNGEVMWWSGTDAEVGPSGRPRAHAQVRGHKCMWTGTVSWSGGGVPQPEAAIEWLSCTPAPAARTEVWEFLAQTASCCELARGLGQALAMRWSTHATLTDGWPTPRALRRTAAPWDERRAVDGR